MAEGPPISFWFTMGSTYTYLTVMRLREVEQATGLTFRWRPFHLLTILQGMKHVPFADKPAKMAYMWRDIERRAEVYGIPVCVPAPYPAKQSIVRPGSEGGGFSNRRPAYKFCRMTGRIKLPGKTDGIER